MSDSFARISISEFLKIAHENAPGKESLKQWLLAAINKMNLVTREEFATQTQVLLRTRMRVEQLEKKLMELNIEVPE